MTVFKFFTLALKSFSYKAFQKILLITSYRPQSEEVSGIKKKASDVLCTSRSSKKERFELDWANATYL